jgi:hypothetical protein
MNGPSEKFIMERFETQRKIFTINAVLLLLAVIGLIIAIPKIFQCISPGIIAKQGAIATVILAGFHLLIFFGFLRGIRWAKDHRRIKRDINTTAALGLGLLGFIMLDGAVETLDKALIISIGYFTCVISDFAAALVSVVALFLLRSKKKNQPA